MTESKTKPYAPRVVSEGDIPVHRTLGEATQTRDAGDYHSDPRRKRCG